MNRREMLKASVALLVGAPIVSAMPAAAESVVVGMDPSAGEDETFVVFVHEDMVQELRGFVPIQHYHGRALYTGEIGRIGRCRVLESPLSPVKAPKRVRSLAPARRREWWLR